MTGETVAVAQVVQDPSDKGGAATMTGDRREALR